MSILSTPGRWVTGHGVLLYWASPTEAGTYIAVPWELSMLNKAPASLTIWRHGKVAGTIPWPSDFASLGRIPYRGAYYMAW